MLEKDNAEKSAVKVYVRVRPLIGREYGSKEIVTVDPDVPLHHQLEQNRQHQ